MFRKGRRKLTSAGDELKKEIFLPERGTEPRCGGRDFLPSSFGECLLHIGKVLWAKNAVVERGERNSYLREREKKKSLGKKKKGPPVIS